MLLITLTMIIIIGGKFFNRHSKHPGWSNQKDQSIIAVIANKLKPLNYSILSTTSGTAAGGIALIINNAFASITNSSINQQANIIKASLLIKASSKQQDVVAVYAPQKNLQQRWIPILEQTL